jgi:hypothetical protein
MSTTRQHIDQMERTQFTFQEMATHFYAVDIDFTNPDERVKTPTLQELLENVARSLDRHPADAAGGGGLPAAAAAMARFTEVPSWP